MFLRFTKTFGGRDVIPLFERYQGRNMHEKGGVKKQISQKREVFERIRRNTCNVV